MDQPQDEPALPVAPGLCGECRHASVKGTSRGTVYLRCTRAAWDGRLARYPRLPVAGCPGFEPAGRAEAPEPRELRGSSNQRSAVSMIGVPHLLHLDSSAALKESRSREITATFADAWRSQGPGHTVTYRDLHRDPLPHLADAVLHWPKDVRPESSAGPAALAAAEALQDELIGELVAADVLLVGFGLYNYTIPSTLKAWLDHVHVAGRTAPMFGGPTRPVAGRPAVLACSRGGCYDAGTPTESWDHSVPVLDIVLGKSMGMAVEAITTSLTLAERNPGLADQVDRSRAELAAAREAAAEAASRLGGKAGKQGAAAGEAR